MPTRDWRTCTQPEVTEAVDFAIEQVNTLSQEDLASRLTLNCSPCECSSLKLAQVWGARARQRAWGVGVDRGFDMQRAGVVHADLFI